MIREAVDILETVLCRFRAAQSTEQALKQLVAPSMVREARRICTDSAELLETVAELHHFDVDALARECAVRLGLPHLASLHVPSRVLINQAGYDPKDLRRLRVMPQRSASSAGWAISVADPSRVAVDEYRARGITVSFSKASAIESMWKEYYSLLQRSGARELDTSQLVSVLARLKKDAVSCGAQEVFIGHPDQSSYEFIAGGKRFVGSLHHAVFAGLQQRLSGEPSPQLCFKEDNGTRLQLGVTKNFINPVFYFTWESAPERETTKSQRGQGRDVQISQTSVREVEPQASPAVLIVDDDRHFASVLRRVLERHGYAANVVGGGEEALQLLEEKPRTISLLISDVHMPKMDGGAFLRELKSSGHAIPVVLLTSDEDITLEAELIGLGASAFVRKQDDIRVLLAWCRNLAAASPEPVEAKTAHAA